MNSFKLCVHSARLFCLAFFLGLLAAVQLHAQAGTGAVQVVGEGGVQVFLDGDMMGVTVAENNGLTLTGVPADRHLLRVMKAGFYMQEDVVVVEAGKTLEYRVRPFQPKLDIVQRGEATSPAELPVVAPKVGSLLIKSEPLSCKISIAALGVGALEKTKDELEIGKVPVGTYTATFSAQGVSVDRTVAIVDGQRTDLFVNILENTVPAVEIGSPVGVDGRSRATDASASHTIPDLALELVWIEPGTFSMGSAEGGEIDERPVTQVTISHGFWLGRTEVTQAQWRALMGDNPARFQGEDRPMESVNWTEAMEFCRKLTAREGAANRLPEGYAYTLPTEAQWEYACRAGAQRESPGDIDAQAWYITNNGNATKPVGQKRPNAWGLFDMYGNVWEWCLDGYDNYPGGSVVDPKGSPKSTYRVFRGGGWSISADYCRAALRLRDEPKYRRNYLGFRLALAPIK